MEQSGSVLIMGGSGQAGAGTAAVLRRWHPSLPLTIAGRDLERAQRVADELGVATATTIDLTRRDLGLPSDHRCSAVVAAVWDGRLHGLRYAQRLGVPYLSISSGLVDIGPEVVAGAQRGAAPVLLASHLCAGVVVLAALDAARGLERVDAVRVGAVQDDQDAGGPAATADLERWAVAAPAGLIRRDGEFTWVAGPDAAASVQTVDGPVLPGDDIAVLDVPSIGLATGAPDVRVTWVVGESAGRRRGGPPSIEVRIELEGVDTAGAPVTAVRTLVHAEGQRPLTAVGLALGVERLIGLRGGPVAPGVHTPESLIDPAYAVARMVEVGTSVSDTGPLAA